MRNWHGFHLVYHVQTGEVSKLTGDLAINRRVTASVPEALCPGIGLRDIPCWGNGRVRNDVIGRIGRKSHIRAPVRP